MFHQKHPASPHKDRPGLEATGPDGLWDNCRKMCCDGIEPHSKDTWGFGDKILEEITF
jgi:hypothetical protein